MAQSSYGALLSSRNVYIATLERRANEFHEKLHGASADEVRARLDAQEMELRTLRLRAQPRRLTQAQRQAIADRARVQSAAQPSAITVIQQEGCGDCPGFAAELIAALRDGGTWTISLATTTDTLLRTRSGLGLRVADPLRPPQSAIVLQQGLRAAGVPFEVMGGGAGDAVEFVVAERFAQ